MGADLSFMPGNASRRTRRRLQSEPAISPPSDTLLPRARVSGSSLPAAAFRDLYCRTTNPARPYMLWISEVREARRLFRAFKSRMAQLVQEVTRFHWPQVHPQGASLRAAAMPHQLCWALPGAMSAEPCQNRKSNIMRAEGAAGILCFF
jgi:hypothetical protein